MKSVVLSLIDLSVTSIGTFGKTMKFQSEYFSYLQAALLSI